ncbi:hypothetical protein [Bacillus sp. FJAT-29937]|uniref:hypothetical protein n=1 Tax=Bacillus sp. FJAT-29937 TaxID=1720553 RepID=UPI00082BE0CB|nr:hypothetical protein [Bacillus sp. FJAT-29937]
MDNKICSFPSCNIQATELLTTIDNGSYKISLCTLHIHEYNKSDELIRLSTEITELLPCSLCNSKKADLQYEVQEMNKSTQIYLCESHLSQLLEHRLSANEYLKLRNKYGLFFDISDHFYEY